MLLSGLTNVWFQVNKMVHIYPRFREQSLAQAARDYLREKDALIKGWTVEGCPLAAERTTATQHRIPIKTNWVGNIRWQPWYSHKTHPPLMYPPTSLVPQIYAKLEKTRHRHRGLIQVGVNVAPSKKKNRRLRFVHNSGNVNHLCFYIISQVPVPQVRRRKPSILPRKCGACGLSPFSC